MAFLFVWQILISGPLEVGSGLVAAAQFSTAIDADYKTFDIEHTRRAEVEIANGERIGVAIGPSRLFGFGLGLVILFLLYRRVTALGKLSLVFLIGVLGVLAWVLFEGAIRFNPSLAFDTSFAHDERPKDWGAALGVGMGFAIYLLPRLLQRLLPGRRGPRSGPHHSALDPDECAWR